ncbi:hypothetical protein BEWA_027330 [Theileria equi strain WA]|uniref:Uncharacterized protein n=1 Tax=Theileria equi strain WA TaxID=1537102 RepID=L0AYD0_THEEQ|nr:hypothetical protein BEWA_027330 [Theileria equi strain WA]AFZ79884.1 hypothetical protein BEWA_027330 [Theileria equi strain WA]|eukprot:XP_004829550.1 hypothetical protein BEWA_027330 [Theileria equi strain WA]
MTKETGGMFPNYTGYEHVSAIKGQDTFTVTSIVNGAQNVQQISDLPLRNVEKVTVYFSACNPTTPAMIYIHYKGLHGREDSKWLKNENGNGKWEDASQYIPIGDGNVMKETIENTLNAITNTLRLCLGSSEPGGVVERIGANASGYNNQGSYGEYVYSGEGSEDE